MEKIGAWGMTEPDAGSDAFGGMKTTARPDGDGYVLSGSKTFITNAPYADILVIYAKIDRGGDLRERPIEAFVVERGMEGLTTSQPMRKMGMHTSPTGLVYLDEVRVGRERLLGEREKPERSSTARASAKDVFHDERTGVVAMCYGIIERCLEVAVDYARNRQAWGRPIGEYQLIQEKLARMVVHKQNVENMLYKKWWMTRNKRRMSLAEASAGKLYSARAATEVAMEAVQVLGGNGYMAEYRVEQLARDAKLLQIGGGTDEIQIVHVARNILTAP
jgi:alkylation response protein AidB-like acyl-CoA dehydrogenase